MRTWNNNKGIQSMRTMSASMRGLTLVELMIAVALGVGVMGGILALYVNVNETASYLNAASRVQENGRFAIDQIGRTLRMAGYDDPATSTAGPTIVMEGKESASISMGAYPVKSTSDAVLISYEGAPLVRDCRGLQTFSDTWVTNIYAISPRTTTKPDELVCRTENPLTKAEVGDPQTIAEGVEDMRILYGVDTDPAPGDGVANTYVSLPNVTNWSNVVSAKVFLLINSVEDVFEFSNHDCESCTPDPNNPHAYLYWSFTPSRLMRAEFSTTIHFRNSLGT